MAIPVPNLVLMVDSKGRMRPLVDGKLIAGVVKIEASGWPEGNVTLQVDGRFVRYEQASDASR